MSWVDTLPCNLRLQAAMPAHPRVDPFDIPGFTQRSGDLVFPWSARHVAKKILGVPPAAWRGPQPRGTEGVHEVEEVFRNPAQLRPYQPEEVRRAVKRGGGHLWTPPGAGKTLMGEAWGLCVTDDPVIYVTRACLRGQAATEFRRWFRPEMGTPIVLRPRSARRANARDDLLDMVFRAPSRPFIIVGWEQLRDETFVGDDLIPLIDRVDPGAIIFDETQFAKAQAEHHVKTEEVDRYGRPVWTSFLDESVAGAALAAAEAIPHRLGLTATPGDTDRGDLHAQLRLIEPWAWGKSARKFLLRHCGAVKAPRAGEPLANGGQIPKWLLTTDVDEGAFGPTNTDEFWLRLDQVARRIPYEVTHGHLPPFHRYVRWVEKADQDRPVESINSELRALAAKAQKGDPRARARIRELEYDDAAQRVRSLAVQMCRERKGLGNGKGILFTGRKRLADMQARALQRAGFRVYLLHGDIPDSVFTERILAAKADPGPCMIVGTPDKLGTGWDLPSFRFTLFCMLPNRVGLIEQSERRADRASRTDEHEAVYLIPRGTRIESDLRHLRDNAKSVADVHKGSGIADLDSLFGGDGERASVLSHLAKVLAGGSS